MADNNATTSAQVSTSTGTDPNINPGQEHIGTKNDKGDLNTPEIVAAAAKKGIKLEAQGDQAISGAGETHGVGVKLQDTAKAALAEVKKMMENVVIAKGDVPPEGPGAATTAGVKQNAEQMTR